MSENLKLCSTKRFNGVKLAYYLDTDNGDFWITREQISSFLGYSNPHVVVARIHKRHSDRLDKLSERIKIPCVKNGCIAEEEVTAYNFKGMLEICRHSRQPNANMIMDCLWEFIEDIAQETGRKRDGITGKEGKNNP